MDIRYENDHHLYPNRVICGTETFTPSIDTNWKLIQKMPACDRRFLLDGF